MNPNILTLVNLISIGPLGLTFLLGGSATLIAGAAATGKLEQFQEAITKSELKIASSFATCLLSGLASFLLLAVIDVLLFRLKPLAFLGLVFFAVIFLLLSSGFICACGVVGECLYESIDRAGSKIAVTMSGLLILGFAALLPIGGWIVVVGIAIAGLGAVIRSMAVRTSA